MNEDLENRLAVMKREIDAMQIAITEQTKPWYKDVSTYLSIVALFFSFGTTFVSYRRTAAEDVLSARHELRLLLQRMAELPKEMAKCQEEYINSPGTAATIGGCINQENSLLARNAAEIAQKLTPKNVYAVEYYSIASALYSSYELASAEKFYRLALTSSPDFNSEISLLRALGNLHFQLGKPEDGRAEYKKALAIFSKYPDYDVYTKLSSNIWTELSWSYSEANFGSMDDAFMHIKSAEGLLAAGPPGPGLNMLRGQVAETRKGLETGKPVALPTPGASLPLPKGINESDAR